MPASLGVMVEAILSMMGSASLLHKRYQEDESFIIFEQIFIICNNGWSLGFKHVVSKLRNSKKLLYKDYPICWPLWRGVLNFICSKGHISGTKCAARQGAHQDTTMCPAQTFRGTHQRCHVATLSKYH